jgi:hypothetical protein
LGALGFDSAGLVVAGFESEALESDCEDFVSDDLDSLDLESLDFDSLEDLESLAGFESPPLLPLSEEPDDAAAPSPFDADFLEAFWSFFPSLP